MCSKSYLLLKWMKWKSSKNYNKILSYWAVLPVSVVGSRSNFCSLCYFIRSRGPIKEPVSSTWLLARANLNAGPKTLNAKSLIRSLVFATLWEYLNGSILCLMTWTGIGLLHRQTLIWSVTCDNAASNLLRMTRQLPKCYFSQFYYWSTPDTRYQSRVLDNTGLRTC